MHKPLNRFKRQAMRSRLVSWGLLLLPSLAWGQPQLRVFILAGQSNMEGRGDVGHLRQLVNDPETRDDYEHLTSSDGSFLVRNDVTLAFGNDIAGLTVGKGANGVKFGPELQFGQVVGDHFSDPVLLIKTAYGGTDLAVDWRPPSSPNPPAEEAYMCGADPCDSFDYGRTYREMVRYVNDLLTNLDSDLPQYAGFELVMSGFVWFQGFNGE